MKKNAFLMLVVLLFAILTGCSTTETPKPTPTPTLTEVLRSKTWFLDRVSVNGVDIPQTSPSWNTYPYQMTFYADNTFLVRTKTLVDVRGVYSYLETAKYIAMSPNGTQAFRWDVSLLNSGSFIVTQTQGTNTFLFSYR